MTKKSLCPICKKPAVEEAKPFCSRGCKSIDLNRWLSGVYRIPGESVASDQLEKATEEDV